MGLKFGRHLKFYVGQNVDVKYGIFPTTGTWGTTFLGIAGGREGWYEEQICYSLLAYSKLKSIFLLEIFFGEQFLDIKNVLIYKVNCNLKLL